MWTFQYLSRRLLLTSLALLLCAATRTTAQVFMPENAHVNLYFPQLADGGSSEQQWQTRFTFGNPNDATATVDVEFFRSDGSPLALDFGAGLSTSLTVSIPPRGTRVIRSTIASPSIVVGWAQAFADIPVQATAAYRVLENGTPKLEVNAEPTLPSWEYRYPATPFLGVAVANVYDSPLSVRLILRDADGGVVGETSLQLGPLGHSAFTVHDRFPGLPGTLEGTLEILATGTPIQDFIAWGLASDSQGIISSLPSGRLARQSHWDNIWLAFLTTLDEARRSEPEVFSAPVELVIGIDNQINAFTAPNGNTIQINLALAELIADSPSELAFAIAHELGHIYQFRTGDQREFHTNAEKDADIWGSLFSLGAGYDPYAIAGVLSKLAMATGTADLVSQANFHNLAVADAHGSFNERAATVFEEIDFACLEEPEACETIKSILHPHFPASAPLLRIREPERRRTPVKAAP